MSTAALVQTLFSLPVEERIELADELYASVPQDWQATGDEAWLKEAERRSAEMDTDPSSVLTEEEFFAGTNTRNPEHER